MEDLYRVVLDNVESYEALENAQQHGCQLQLCSVGDEENWRDFPNDVQTDLRAFSPTRYRAVVLVPGEPEPRLVGYTSQGQLDNENDRPGVPHVLPVVLGEYSIPVYAHSVPGEQGPRVAVLEQFMADASDDMECLPECDSLAHSDQCPVAHTGQAFRVLRERIAELESALAEGDPR